MLSLIDAIELEILEQTGDIDQAERVGIGARYTLDALTDMIGMLLGPGPSITADMRAALDFM